MDKRLVELEQICMEHEDFAACRNTYISLFNSLMKQLPSEQKGLLFELDEINARKEIIILECAKI